MVARKHTHDRRETMSLKPADALDSAAITCNVASPIGHVPNSIALQAHVRQALEDVIKRRMEVGLERLIALLPKALAQNRRCNVQLPPRLREVDVANAPGNAMRPRIPARLVRPQLDAVIHPRSHIKPPSHAKQGRQPKALMLMHNRLNRGASAHDDTIQAKLARARHLREGATTAATSARNIARRIEKRCPAAPAFIRRAGVQTNDGTIGKPQQWSTKRMIST